MMAIQFGEFEMSDENPAVDPVVAETPVETPAEEIVPASEPEAAPIPDSEILPASDFPVDTSVGSVVPNSDSSEDSNALFFRIEWIDGGGGAQSVSLGSHDIALGFIVGLMQDGRNRDAVLVDEA